MLEKRKISDAKSQYGSIFQEIIEDGFEKKWKDFCKTQVGTDR